MENIERLLGLLNDEQKELLLDALCNSELNSKISRYELIKDLQAELGYGLQR